MKLILHSATGEGNHTIEFVDDLGPLIDQNVDLRPLVKSDAAELARLLFHHVPSTTVHQAFELIKQWNKED